MISKARLKYIHSLERKKIRKEEGVFVAEGPKVVGDLLQVLPVKMVVATTDWLEQHASCLSHAEVIAVSEDELRKVSFLQHPQDVLAVFPQKESLHAFDSRQCALALDDIQDPGNLGTIIRIADWFGIERVYCSL
ncbi:MAG: RNA methyltransferase, partial [Prevotella sp.]|nr:RNA methyltransferase [Prevotella sp.]